MAGSSETAAIHLKSSIAFLGRDGRYRWFRSRAIPVRDAAGGLERWVGISSDIHFQKQAEQALTQQRLVLETLIESTADFIYMKDREGRYVFVNSSAARSVGKPAHEIIGKDDRDLFPEESARPIMEKDRQIMASGISEVFEETRSAAGRTRHLHSSKNVCRDASGAVIGMVGISRDITALRQVEDVLNSNELNAAGARMANALAHEINNPLAAITNALFLSPSAKQGIFTRCIAELSAGISLARHKNYPPDDWSLQSQCAGRAYSSGASGGRYAGESGLTNSRKGYSF